MYYSNKLNILGEIFGTSDIELKKGFLNVAGRAYPIIDDVIILLSCNQLPPTTAAKIPLFERDGENLSSIEKSIQYTFSEEWKTYNKILPEHDEEFKQYFDIVDLQMLQSKRIGDFGCGNGRWAYFLKDIAKEMVLVDFSESIFEARKNLSDSDNIIFIMADVLDLPFQDNTFDFIYSLGVLHHIPVPALQSVRKLSRFGPELLIYLYYALDNRGVLYKSIFYIVNLTRKMMSNITSGFVRSILTEVLMWIFYSPPIIIGKVLSMLGVNPSNIPLSSYLDKSLERIRQDVYDRFFTRVEQRLSKTEILGLSDTFSDIKVSDNLPYWHFLCRK